jgi:hypothetical protein
MRWQGRIGVSARKSSTLGIGIGFALSNPKKRTTPPVFAFELAAMRIQALAAFFSHLARSPGGKPLICKVMANTGRFHAIAGEQTLTIRSILVPILFGIVPALPAG